MRSNSKSHGVASFFLLAMGLFSIQPARAAFQENLWGARPAGMAGAFTAVADDANAPSYNPAGIAFLTSSELTVMYAQILTGLDLHAGNDSSKLGLGYFSVAPQIRDNKFGSYAFTWANFTATNLLREDSFSVTYANTYKFDKLETKPVLGFGANLKYLRHTFTTDAYSSSDPTFAGGQSAGAGTVDAGLLYRPNFSQAPGLRVGLVGQNMTEPNVGLNSTDRVPSRYALGFAYQDIRYRLFNPALDFSRRAGRTVITLGWEGWMAKDTIAIRLGGNADEMGGGLGYQFRLTEKLILGFDYSLLWPLNVQGTNGNHRVSLSMKF